MKSETCTSNWSCDNSTQSTVSSFLDAEKGKSFFWAHLEFGLFFAQSHFVALPPESVQQLPVSIRIATPELVHLIGRRSCVGPTKSPSMMKGFRIFGTVQAHRVVLRPIRWTRWPVTRRDSRPGASTAPWTIGRSHVQSCNLCKRMRRLLSPASVSFHRSVQHHHVRNGKPTYRQSATADLRRMAHGTRFVDGFQLDVEDDAPKTSFTRRIVRNQVPEPVHRTKIGRIVLAIEPISQPVGDRCIGIDLPDWPRHQRKSKRFEKRYCSAVFLEREFPRHVGNREFHLDYGIPSAGQAPFHDKDVVQQQDRIASWVDVVRFLGSVVPDVQLYLSVCTCVGMRRGGTKWR